MQTFLRAASCVLALLTCPAVFAAETPELTPPVADGSTDVPYPAGAEGDAAVVLELVVAIDGSVSSATVVEGVEPFAEHARLSALTWHFVPALRMQVPVAARIRARVAFHRDPEPSVAPSSPLTTAVPAAPGSTSSATSATPAAATSATPTSAAPPEVTEITVHGERGDIGQTTLSKSDVRQMPGAFGDAFRAIEALPGVAPLVSGIPYFFVRGAPPNNAGYFIDGIRVPLLFHLGLAQGVIHPGLVERVDFFPSAAPARYGGYAGPIIAGSTREPASAPHGEANLRLLDAGTLLETPFADGRGSVLVAARYGYPGAILALVTDDLRIGYWDYQARATWNLGPNDTVGVFAFGSHDYLASRSPSGDPEAAQEMQEQFVSDFHRVDLRYDHTLSAGRLRLALTGGHDRQGAEPTYMTDKSLGARLQLDQRFSESLQLRAGASSQLEYYRIRLTRQGPGEPVVPQSANPPPTNLGGGLHADVVWRPSQRVELVPGARFDLYHSSRVDESGSGRTSTFVPALDPRLSARVRITPAVAWLSTFGLSHQYPSLRVGEIPGPVASIAGFPFGDRKLQSTAQTSQGIELLLPADLMFTATGFYSYFWGLTDLAAGCFQLENATPPPPTPGRPTMFVPPYVCPNNDPVTGRAYGVELLLRRPFSKRLGGMLSYTLSRATKRAHFLSLSGDDERATVPSEFDRTHVLNLILGYDLGRRWRVGSRLVFYTGTPHSKLEGSLPVPPYNAYRNPAFYRVDFRLEKSWRLGRNGSLAFVLEGQNVTLSKEVSGFGGLDCEGTQNGPEATTTCKQPTVGPLTLPSVGIEAVF